MPQVIDSTGSFIAKITEHGVGLTQKGYPQFIARFDILKKYVEDKEELEHFELKEPQWVDYSEFGYEATGYFVLFNDADEFNDDSKLLNYEQVQLALGWDGSEFDSLGEDKYLGTEVLIRVQEREYNDKVSLRVEWIDSKDASPNRELRKLDADKLKGLGSKLKVSKSKPKPAAAAAKPKPGKPGPKKAEEKPKSAPPAKSTPPKKEPEPEPEQEEPAQDDGPALDPMDQGSAWEYVNENKGDSEDSVVAEAWIAACTEVSEAYDPPRDDSSFEEADWAKVAQITLKDLG